MCVCVRVCVRACAHVREFLWLRMKVSSHGRGFFSFDVPADLADADGHAAPLVCFCTSLWGRPYATPLQKRLKRHFSYNFAVPLAASTRPLAEAPPVRRKHACAVHAGTFSSPWLTHPSPQQCFEKEVVAGFVHSKFGYPVPSVLSEVLFRGLCGRHVSRQCVSQASEFVRAPFCHESFFLQVLSAHGFHADSQLRVVSLTMEYACGKGPRCQPKTQQTYATSTDLHCTRSACQGGSSDTGARVPHTSGRGALKVPVLDLFECDGPPRISTEWDGALPATGAMSARVETVGGGESVSHAW